MRDRKGIDPDARGGEEHLWIAEGVETVVKIHNKRENKNIKPKCKFI